VEVCVSQSNHLSAGVKVAAAAAAAAAAASAAAAAAASGAAAGAAAGLGAEAAQGHALCLLQRPLHKVSGGAAARVVGGGNAGAIWVQELDGGEALDVVLQQVERSGGQRTP
jgi:hypothetical protein